MNEAGNSHGVFVTIVFFTDQTAMARMFLFLRTHMAAKLPIVYFAARQYCDHCRRVPNQAQWYGDILEPSHMAFFVTIVFFTDQTAMARMFLFLRTHMAAKLPIVYFAARQYL